MQDVMARVARPRANGSAWRVLRFLWATGALAACQNTAEPVLPGPPYLVVVSKPQGASLDENYRYRIRDLSSLQMLDTTITVTARDTILLSVKPSTYSVQLEGLSARCRSRYGPEEVVVVPEGTNTALSRFYLICGASLTISVATSGVRADSLFVWEVSGPSYHDQGVIASNATLVLPELPAGTYTVALDHVSSNCTFTNDGGGVRSVEVTENGGVDVNFSAVCSVPEQRPGIVSFYSSYHDGVGVFVARATSPVRNLANYYWDITDCHGNSILPGGVRGRQGLLDGRTANADSLTIVAGWEIGVADADFSGKCATLRVEDNYGNTSPTVERPLTDDVPARPVVSEFNAVLNGPDYLRTTFAVTDPNNDYVGTFVSAVLRDGILGPPDGKEDIGIYNVQGYLGPQVPDLPFNSRIAYTDLYGVILYVVDARGNFVRLQDMDTFR